MTVASRRHPIIEGVRLLALKALGRATLPDDDGQLLVDPMNALPKAETFADWGIQESWSIQVAYQIISEDVRAGLQVMVEPNGLEGRPERQALTPLSTDAEHR